MKLVKEKKKQSKTKQDERIQASSVLEMFFKMVM